MGTDDPTGDAYPHGMSMRVNLYSPVDMGNPTELFFLSCACVCDSNTRWLFYPLASLLRWPGQQTKDVHYIKTTPIPTLLASILVTNCLLTFLSCYGFLDDAVVPRSPHYRHMEPIGGDLAARARATAAAVATTATACSERKWWDSIRRSSSDLGRVSIASRGRRGEGAASNGVGPGITGEGGTGPFAPSCARSRI